jgi:hypothetical protein
MPLSPLPAGVFLALNLYLRYSKCNFRPVKVNEYCFGLDDTDDRRPKDGKPVTKQKSLNGFHQHHPWDFLCGISAPL